MPTSYNLDLVEEQASSEEAQNGLYLSARKLVLFSIGVMALFVEETAILMDRLIERGQIAQQDSRRLLRETEAKRQSEARKVRAKMHRPAKEARVQATMPSKAEIDALNEKIARLSEQLDQLKKNQA